VDNVIGTPCATDDDHETSCPRVSIITIFLNAEKFLPEAVDSVLAQTFEDWEYLLVDDGSNDASTAIAKRYEAQYPEKIRYLEHPGHFNRGMSAARNLGLEQARGQYVAFVDADDVWTASKLADQIAILETYPAIGMLSGSANYWSSWSGGHDVVIRTGHKRDTILYPPEASLALYPLGGTTSPCPSDILVCTRLAKMVGGFEEHFTGPNQMYEDQAFLAKIYLEAPVYFSSKVWISYRQHADSCVASVSRAGKYHEVRLYFLNWFEAYLKNKPKIDCRIFAALDRALRPYRRPRVDYLLKLPSRLSEQKGRLRSLVGRVARRLSRLVRRSA
jgi:glycosyltransferase involved in cell wall biosynthesis